MYRLFFPHRNIQSFSRPEIIPRTPPLRIHVYLFFYPSNITIETIRLRLVYIHFTPCNSFRMIVQLLHLPARQRRHLLFPVNNQTEFFSLISCRVNNCRGYCLPEFLEMPAKPNRTPETGIIIHTRISIHGNSIHCRQFARFKHLIGNNPKCSGKLQFHHDHAPVRLHIPGNIYRHGLPILFQAQNLLVS